MFHLHNCVFCATKLGSQLWTCGVSLNLSLRLQEWGINLRPWEIETLVIRNTGFTVNDLAIFNQCTTIKDLNDWTQRRFWDLTNQSRRSSHQNLLGIGTPFPSFSGSLQNHVDWYFWGLSFNWHTKKTTPIWVGDFFYHKSRKKWKSRRRSGKNDWMLHRNDRKSLGVEWGLTSKLDAFGVFEETTEFLGWSSFS